MKNLLMGLLFVSCIQARAEDLVISMKNFNFEYAAPLGEGTATYFSQSRRKLEGPLAVHVEKVNDDFNFVINGTEESQFKFENAPSIFLDAERMQVVDLNFQLVDNIEISLAQGRFFSVDDTIKMDGFTLNCARDLSLSDLGDQMLSGCLQKMLMKASKFSSVTTKTEHLAHLLSQSILSAVSDGLQNKSDITVKGLEFKITSGKYNLAADLKAEVSGKVKSHGSITYDYDLKQVTIKISEVKFGLFNITSKVFDELRKHESDSIKIKEPYVYLTK